MWKIDQKDKKSYLESENIRVEQVWSGGLVPVGGARRWGNGEGG
jgi:hypothetical protein